MKILADNGRNRHGQRLVRVECSCGRVIESVLFNNIKSGRTKTCGKCHQPQAAGSSQPPETEISAEVASQHPRGSVAWLDDQIQSKERAALAAEVRVRNLQAALAAAESTDLNLLKCWTAESTAFEKLNHQIARLKIQKAEAETAQVKTKSSGDVVRDKIRALKECQ
jgi:hypothetical protein